MIPEPLKQAIRHTFVFGILRRSRDARAIQRWLAEGCPLPPPHAIKRQTVLRYAKSYSLRTFIETGTYLGQMVEAMIGSFDRVITIELAPALFHRAQARFRWHRQVTVRHGDSGTVLPEILKDLTTPALFWLDGHYSEGITAKGEQHTPIVKELRAILNHPVRGHVILIDDARCFVGENDYPTIDALRQLVAETGQVHTFEVKDDIVRVQCSSEVPGRKMA